MVTKEDKQRLEDEKSIINAEMELTAQELEAVDMMEDIQSQLLSQLCDVLHMEYPDLTARQVMRVQLAVLRSSAFWAQNYLNREE